jgi:hypothetical protein
MATNRQKEAARRNIAKACQAQSARAHGKSVPRQSEGMSTAEQNRLADQKFAFPRNARNR